MKLCILYIYFQHQGILYWDFKTVLVCHSSPGVNLGCCANASIRNYAVIWAKVDGFNPTSYHRASCSCCIYFYVHIYTWEHLRLHIHTSRFREAKSVRPINKGVLITVKQYTCASTYMVLSIISTPLSLNVLMYLLSCTYHIDLWISNPHQIVDDCCL